MCTYVRVAKATILFALLFTFYASCSGKAEDRRSITPTNMAHPENESEILMLLSLAKDQAREYSFDMESYEFRLTKKGEYRILEFYPKRVATRLPDGKFVVGADGGGTLLFKKLNGDYEFVGHFVSQ